MCQTEYQISDSEVNLKALTLVYFNLGEREELINRVINFSHTTRYKLSAATNHSA